MVCTTHSITYRRIDVTQKIVLARLIHDKNKKLTMYQSLDPAEALEKAKIIEHKLELRIFDATYRKKKWLN